MIYQMRTLVVGTLRHLFVFVKMPLSRVNLHLKLHSQVLLLKGSSTEQNYLRSLKITYFG